jgi:hypothetical protein
MGSILIGSGEMDGATRALERSPEFLPENTCSWRADAWLNLDVIHHQKGELE